MVNPLWYLTPETVGLAILEQRLKEEDPAVAFQEFRKYSIIFFN